MNIAQPQAIYLKDYKKPNYFIESTKLDFELFEDKTLVHSNLLLVKNEENNDSSLALNGHELQLLKVAVDGVLLSKEEYSLDAEYLTLKNLPSKFTLQITTQNQTPRKYSP